MASSLHSPRDEEHTHVHNTPNSSVTMLERARSLNEETADDERRIHQYGGDDTSEPSPKPQPDEKASPVFKLPTPDPNMITWDGPEDPSNPQNWSKAKKWGVTAVCILSALNVSFASSAPTSATAEIVQYFGISMEVSYLMTTLFLLGYVFGPIIWGPGSELVGRRPIFVVSVSSYTVLILGQALAKNTETLLVTRFLSGFFAASPLTNSGGVIADIWDAEGRGPATSLFSASVFLGPVLGPIISGAINQSPLHWRWVFWIMLIFAGVCNSIMVLTLPETYAPVLLLKKLKRVQKQDPEGTKHLFAEHSKQDWSFKGLMHRTILRPFIMLAIEPILLLITIYISLVYGVLYCLFQAIPIIFIQKRGFTILQNGLIFIGVGIGTTLASIFFLWSGRHYPVLIKKWKGFPPPENRLFGAMVGAPLFVVGIFWLGWTGNYASVHWAVPAVSTILVGASINLIFMSFLSYLVDTYLMFAASAFASNTIVRSAVAAAFPLFTVQMFSEMTVKWAATLLGLVALLLAPSPFLFYKYGPKVREHSKFAPCIDLKIAKMMAESEKQTV